VKYAITSHQIPGDAGWKVLVRLAFTAEEHILINKHRMASDHPEALEIASYRGEPLKFKRFYGGVHATTWDIDSSYQATKFIAALKKGFEQFNWFMEQNRTHPDVQLTPPSFNFFERDRFSHVRVVATTGSGKTTFLSALINEDLENVKRREGSVLVIDSQNEHLGQYLPRLARFGPGGDLYGKLIYLAPDLLHPLALNIFDFTGYQRLDANERLELLNTVRDMLMFFIGALIGEASGHMRNVIGYALEALVLIPDATVFTFKDLLAKGGLAALTEKYPSLTALDQDTTKFLTTGMFADYGQSIGSVRTRLDAITRDAFTKATFAQPQNRLNLFELLKEPYVIVVNTDSKRLGEETTALFGRFFLASLLRMVRRRIGGGLPVYVYADEAQQYIAQEEAVIDLIREARRQNVSLTLAHHRHSDIKSDAVKQALQGTAVQCRPSPPHKWVVTVREGLPVEVTPPNINFEYMPQMDRVQWRDILDGMHACFSPPLKEQKKKNNPSPLPDDDATADR
jgi:hypothetical protein